MTNLPSIVVGVMLLVASFHPGKCDVMLDIVMLPSHPMEGHSTELTCNVRSMNQSQVIVWSKDQKFITWGEQMGQIMSPRFELVMNSVNSSEETLMSYTLIINDITRDDDGRYQCQVLQENGNGFSAMASETVVLSVLYFPDSMFPVCSLNGTRTLLTGTELTVSCISEVGNPQITSTWIAADDAIGQMVYQTVESSGMMVSELELTATRDLDGATYICQVTSPAYPEFYRTCSLGPLRIIDWPIVIVTRSVPRVTEGGEVQFLCDTEPRMPILNWVTVPSIDPDRLVVTDDGAILTVKNVQQSDNLTNVVCQVPHRNKVFEAYSVIIMHESNINSPPAMSQLCIPWFGAFLFTVAVNLVMCFIIVFLLRKVRKLTSKLSVESDEHSLKGINMAMMVPQKKDVVPTRQASRQSVLSNWSLRSEKGLRDQRHRSWQYTPGLEADDHGMDGGETLTYTELSPDTLEGKKTRKKQLRKTVSLAGINIPAESDSYVTPSTRTKPMAKACTSSLVQKERKTGQASLLSPSIKLPTSKSGKHSKMRGIKTISDRIPMELSSATATSSYMDLNEKPEDLLPQKQTYQALQKTPHSSRNATQPAASSMKKNLKKSAKDMNGIMGDSGIYGESGPYMKYGDGGELSTDSDGSKATPRRDSMIGESSSYMPAGVVQRGRTKPTTNQCRSGTMTSESSVDTHDTRYEIPPYDGSTDDSMGGAIYTKSLGFKGKGIPTTRSKSLGTVSSRAPFADPTTADQQDVHADTASTDGSYKEPYEDSRAYFVLEPVQRSHTNYGADISSDEKSYLELGDAEGEIRGYMDMTKVEPEQVKMAADITKMAPGVAKASSKVTKGTVKVNKGPSKATKQVRNSDSEFSLNEYYEQMAADGQSQEYAVPPSNKLRSVVAETDSRGPGTGNSESSPVSDNAPSTVEHKRKRGGWGPFKK